MMDGLSNYFGTICCAILCGIIASLFFSSRKTRVIVATSVAAFTMIPLTRSYHSIANYAFAFYDIPSLSTLYVAFLALLRPGVSFSVRFVWKLLVVVLGGALYLTEFNVLPFDLYRWGYVAPFMVIASGTAVVLGDTLVALMASASVVLTVSGVYANYFDALLDFPFWCIMVVHVAVCVVNGSFWRKRRPNYSVDNV